MKYLKHHYVQSLLNPRRRNDTFQTSNTTNTKKKHKSRPSSFEDNLAESCLHTKKMIDDYEYQVDAMKRRHRAKRCDVSKRQSRDRYDVYRAGYGHHVKHHEIEMDEDGDEEDSLTSLTDDLTYLQSARRETATRIRRGLDRHNDDDDGDNTTFLPGSANEPLDVTMYDTLFQGGEEDREDRNDNMHQHHPFNRESRRHTGISQNARSGRFSSTGWKESIRRRPSLFNTAEEDEDDGEEEDYGEPDEDYGEPDEDWPGARIPLTQPVRRRQQQQQQQNRKQSRRNRRLLVDKINEFDAAMGEVHRGEAEAQENLIMRHHHTETQRLKQALIDQRQKYDEEKGALYIELERLKRDHGLEVDKLQSDLDQAQESHQMYLKKLNEVINYHEILHEKETVTMNKIVAQVKKEKLEEVSRLNRELEELKSAPKFDFLQTDDPDIQQCIKYLSIESDAQKHRRAQFMDTMNALQSIASKTSNKNAVGFTNRDLQDIDGLLDMLHHVYNVAESSHQKTLCMSHMLIEECTEMSKTANDFRKMKDRLDCLERESSILPPPPPVLEATNHRPLFRRGREPQEIRGNNMSHNNNNNMMMKYRVDRLELEPPTMRVDPLHLPGLPPAGGPVGQEVCGNSIDELTQTIGSFDELTKSMETSLYRGLGLIK